MAALHRLALVLIVDTCSSRRCCRCSFCHPAAVAGARKDDLLVADDAGMNARSADDSVEAEAAVAAAPAGKSTDRTRSHAVAIPIPQWVDALRESEIKMCHRGPQQQYPVRT